MLRPPLLLLMRLERDPDTQQSLRFSIVQKREIETPVRKARNAKMDIGLQEEVIEPIAMGYAEASRIDTPLRGRPAPHDLGIGLRSP
jgi:hypothetical protein